MTSVLTCRSLTDERVPVGFTVRARRLLTRCRRAVRCRYAEVAVVFVGSTTIRTLNRAYRKHDQVTDVLSFTYHSDPVVGDIVIYRAQAERQARRAHHSFARELDLLFTHGCLHLAGYDHIKIGERATMRALEQQVLRYSLR